MRPLLTEEEGDNATEAVQLFFAKHNVSVDLDEAREAQVLPAGCGCLSLELSVRCCRGVSGDQRGGYPDAWLQSSNLSCV